MKEFMLHNSSGEPFKLLLLSSEIIVVVYCFNAIRPFHQYPYTWITCTVLPLLGFAYRLINNLHAGKCIVLSLFSIFIVIPFIYFYVLFFKHDKHMAVTLYLVRCKRHNMVFARLPFELIF